MIYEFHYVSPVHRLCYLLIYGLNKSKSLEKRRRPLSFNILGVNEPVLFHGHSIITSFYGWKLRQIKISEGIFSSMLESFV